MDPSIAITIGIFSSILCGVLAANKHRSVGGWIALGFFFGVIPLIIVACLPKLAPRQSLPQAHETMIGVGYYPHGPQAPRR